LFSAKEEAKAFTDQPIIGFFGLSSPEEKQQRIVLRREESTKESKDLAMKFMETIDFDGKKYTITTAQTGVLDFIFDDTPMLNFVYNRLREYLESHFETMKKSAN
jgi:hypothetical protein